MDAVTAAYWAAAGAFVVGVAVVVALYRTAGDARLRSVAAALGIIPVFAGLSYVGMALGVATTTVNGVQFVGLRYLDWLVTTPVLVGFVGYVAGADRRTIAAVMAADALMILAGAGAVLTTGPLKWGLFAVSSLFHLSLFAGLYAVLPRYLPDNPRRIGLFSLLRNHIALLWLAYPFVWLMGPPGLGYATLVGTSMVYAFLDVLAKVPYVYFFYARRHALDEEVVAEAPAGEGVAAD